MLLSVACMTPSLRPSQELRFKRKVFDFDAGGRQISLPGWTDDQRDFVEAKVARHVAQREAQTFVDGLTVDRDLSLETCTNRSRTQ